ncbi:MAG: GTPase HflX [Desulfobacteraceae bacterium]|jgi:GTP-binding protein HflX
MKKIFGNTVGLKANQNRKLQNLYRRRIPPEFLITFELARDVCLLSHEIHRQIGLLIARNGRIAFVIVGDPKQIVIPSIEHYRTASGRLSGLRCIHTHLQNESLTNDDLADLCLLRLDLMAAIQLTKEGRPRQIHAAHILPKSSEGKAYQILDPLHPRQLNIDCQDLIQALETELARVTTGHKANSGSERALLVSIASSSRQSAHQSIIELTQLATSSGLDIAGTIVQHLAKTDSALLIGRGKLQELAVMALQEGATVIIFDQELNASQIRSITDKIDLKVIDRTQLILDIFAQRARTREGRLQVELAQLKYLLPRLVTKNSAMSRLTGGIGGRGPGETKLEINRRRARERIAKLEKALSEVRKHRQQQRARRQKKRLPIISIIGYTNAGKSTLLNTLTKSNVLVEHRLFATLDPSSRRLKFPRDIDVIITDTVGFIKDLPKDLMVAFRATLEELEGADLLLHVIDISNPQFVSQIKAVDRIVSDLKLKNVACLRVLNKMDLVDPTTVYRWCRNFNATAISAKNRSTLMPLIEKMGDMVEPMVNH